MPEEPGLVVCDEISEMNESIIKGLNLREADEVSSEDLSAAADKFDEILISSKEADIMKHTLGYRSDRVKKRHYAAFRNYFYTEPSCSDGLICESLCKKGLMRSARSDEYRKLNPRTPVYYQVTERGLKYLGDIIGITIKETE